MLYLVQSAFLSSFGHKFLHERTHIHRVSLLMARDTFLDVAPLLDAACGSNPDTPLGHLLGDYMIGLQHRPVGPQRRPMFRALRALPAWLDATIGPEAAPGASILEATKDASKRLTDERKTGRDKILQDVVLQRMSAGTARNGLDMLAWAEGGFFHAWRLAESLRIASRLQARPGLL